MARRTADSATKIKCMKNIWETQLPNDIPLEWNQKIANILGAVAVERRTSAKASMERKKYMGSWRLRSVTIRKIKRTLPMTATMYIEQMGMAIQVCRSSSPGIPIRTYHTSVDCCDCEGRRPPSLSIQALVL